MTELVSYAEELAAGFVSVWFLAWAIRSASVCVFCKGRCTKLFAFSPPSSRSFFSLGPPLPAAS